MSANFAQTVLSASLTSGGTSLVVSTPSAPFTVPVAGVGRVTLINDAYTPTAMEIITYTGRTDNGNGTFTYTGLGRAAEGTTALAWSAGDTVLQSLTAGQYAADLAARAATNDSRLSDAREWTAETVSQVEAEAGTATTRRAWTALAVKQTVVAWFFANTTGFGRAWMNLLDTAAARTALGLGSAATTAASAYATAAQGTKADTAARLNAAQSFTAAQRGGLVALTDGATITPDFSVANNFTVTLAGNRTLANPTNQVAGQSGCISIVQDATGSRALAFGSNWKFDGGVPTLNTAANSRSMLYYYVDVAGVFIHASLSKPI